MSAREQVRLAREYEAVTADRRRKADGVVTTPVEIVDFMVRAVHDVAARHGIDLSDAQWMDPFAGTGIFFARLFESCAAEELQSLVDRVTAIEIDSGAADVAEHNLRRIIYRRGAVPPLDRRLVVVGDTFAMGEAS